MLPSFLGFAQECRPSKTDYICAWYVTSQDWWTHSSALAYQGRGCCGSILPQVQVIIGYTVLKDFKTWIKLTKILSALYHQRGLAILSHGNEKYSFSLGWSVSKPPLSTIICSCSLAKPSLSFLIIKHLFFCHDFGLRAAHRLLKQEEYPRHVTLCSK